MKSVLRLAFGIVPLALLSAAAYFGGQGISAWTASLLESPPVPRLGEAQRSSPENPRRSANAILERNPFDSVVGPLIERKEEPPPLDTTVNECSDLLVHVIVAAEEAAWSFASFQTDKGSVLGKTGDRVGRREIRRIDAESIVMGENQEGRTCILHLYPAAKASGQVDAGGTSSGPLSQGTRLSGIEERRKNEFVVDRAVRDRLIEDFAELFRGVQTVPMRDQDGTMVIRIGGARPGTPLLQLGVRNGDRLLSVNGRSLGDPAEMVSMFAQLRMAPRLSLVLRRGSENVQIEYAIE